MTSVTEVSVVDWATLLVALAFAVIALALRPRSAVSWLGLVIAVGGGLGLLESLVRGDGLFREVARLIVLIGAAGLLHLMAILVGLRDVPVEPAARRGSVALPATLYALAFASWIGLELVNGADWGQRVPSSVFLASCPVALGFVVFGVLWSTPEKVLPLLPGLVLLCVVGIEHVVGSGRLPPGASMFALAVFLAGFAWEQVGDELRSRLARERTPRRVRPGVPTLAADSTLAAFFRDLARAEDGPAIVRVVRDDLARRGGRLLAVVGGAADAALEEVAPDGERAALTIDPADPLYVALRAGTTVTSDQVESTEDTPAPARAAVHRLETIGAHVAAPLPTGTRFVGGLLVSPEDGRVADVLTWLDVAVAPVGLALERLHASETARTEVGTEAPSVATGTREETEPASRALGIVGSSDGIRAVVEQIERVAPTDAAVFVRGETGTGKESVVEAIHSLSSRAERELVKIACAALPEPLLESELFGYEPGAFTGAVDRKPGRFEVADGGTLFFDDVDTLPAGVQAKLLRALQEGEVQRLGSNQVRVVDVRVVAATNRDLLEDVRAGKFREDLYYRLNVVPIELPALRDRKEDIPLLVDHFIALEGGRLGRSVDGIAEDSLAEIEAYDWPGNVRELRNAIERALVMTDGDVLRVATPSANDVTEGAAHPDGLGRASLPELLRRYKVRLVTHALELSDGNQRRAAEMLGIHRPSLTRMVRELGLRDGAPPKRARKSG